MRLCGQCECHFYQFVAGIRLTDLGDPRLNHIGVTLYKFIKVHDLVSSPKSGKTVRKVARQ